MKYISNFLLANGLMSKHIVSKFQKTNFELKKIVL